MPLKTVCDAKIARSGKNLYFTIDHRRYFMSTAGLRAVLAGLQGKVKVATVIDERVRR